MTSGVNRTFVIVINKVMSNMYMQCLQILIETIFRNVKGINKMDSE